MLLYRLWTADICGSGSPRMCADTKVQVLHSFFWYCTPKMKYSPKDPTSSVVNLLLVSTCWRSRYMSYLHAPPKRPHSTPKMKYSPKHSSSVVVNLSLVNTCWQSRYMSYLHAPPKRPHSTPKMKYSPKDPTSAVVNCC